MYFLVKKMFYCKTRKFYIVKKLCAIIPTTYSEFVSRLRMVKRDDPVFPGLDLSVFVFLPLSIFYIAAILTVAILFSLMFPPYQPFAFAVTMFFML